jgi:hypothetical protein
MEMSERIPLEDELEILKENFEEFLEFMKAKYPLYHLSNVFIRDLQYAIRNYFLERRRKISFSESEYLSFEFARFMEGKGIFKLVKDEYNKVRVLNYPKFKKPGVQKSVKTQTKPGG